MEKIKILISEEEIQERISEIAAQIMKDYPEKKEIVLVGVLTGAVYFTIDLFRKIKNKVNLQFVKVSSYENNKSNGVPHLDYQLKDSITAKDVIVVEDIIDTGITMNYLLDYLRMQKPKTLKLCVLLNKKIKKTHDIPCDYIGFDIEDKYVVGYGLDDNGYNRNLPYIGYVVKEDEPVKVIKKEMNV